MGVSRSFGDQSPAKPHLVIGSGGLAGEIYDLRQDIDVSFVSVEAEIDTVESTVDDNLEGQNVALWEATQLAEKKSLERAAAAQAEIVALQAALLEETRARAATQRVLDLMSAALGGDISRSVSPAAEDITLAELNGAGPVQREFIVSLKAGGGSLHKWLTGLPTVTMTEQAAAGGIGVPTLDLTPTIHDGKIVVRHTIDQGGTYVSGTESSGSIACDNGGTAVIPADTNQFVLDDGDNPAVTFQFNLGTPVVETATLREVDITTAVDDDDVRDAIILSVTNAPTLDITASSGGAGIVNFVNDNVGVAGDVAITDTVVSGNFAPTGMSGGVDADTVKGTVDFSGIPILGPLLANVDVIYTAVP